MPKLICDVDGCDREITEGTGSKGGTPVCIRCRAAQYSLAKLTEKAIVEKRERYQYWENRLDYLHPRIRKMMQDAERKVTVVKRMAHHARAH